jgi:alpha-L-fucosidase 2
MSTRREFIERIALAAASTVIPPAHAAPVTAEPAACGSTPSAATAMVAKYKAVFTEPPKQVPFKYRVDAPLLGNGDMLAALAGAAEAPQLWLTLNDFWELKNETWLMGLTESVLTPSGNGQGGPRPVGRLVLQFPALAGGSYHVEQDLATATTYARYETSASSLEMRSWIAATENLLVIELTAKGQALEGSVVFHFPDEMGAGVTGFAPLGGLDEHPLQEKGLEEDVLWATRTYQEGVDMPTKAVVAAHFLDPMGVSGQSIVGAPPFGGRVAVADRGPRLTVRLEPGRTQTLAVAMRSWFKHLSPLKAARGRVQWIRVEDVQALRELHEAWWRKYWNVSSIEVDDPVVEQRYYLSHYVMGSLSRDADFPPNIFGFESWDRPMWCGDHKIDYNYEMSFAAMYSSGRFEQAFPYEAPLLAAMDNAHEMARRLPIGRRGGLESVPSRDATVKNGHRGVYFAIGLGPKGHLPENGSWGAKNQNAFALMPIAWRWNFTYDLEYAWKVYPLVRDVANFWEDDLLLRDGKYVMKGDCSGECGGTEDALDSENAGNGLSFLRATFRLVLQLSDALGVDCSRREKWQHILDQLSPYPTARAEQLQANGMTVAALFPAGGDRTVFVEQQGSNQIGRQWIVYPSGEIGLGSDPQLLKIAQDTAEAEILRGKVTPNSIEVDEFPSNHNNPWRDFNFDCIFFPATVRIGYDPEVIWRELRSAIIETGAANGFRADNPHGLEKANLVPNTVNEMMLLSHENVLRFFRVWPRKSHPNARFRDLRAYGAFRVSAALIGGNVTDVHITSEMGRECRIENPWSGRRVTVFRDGRKAETLQGNQLTLTTKRGETIELKV